MLDFTGDSVLLLRTMLKLIDYLKNLQYLFLYAIVYVSILLNIESSSIEFILNKILPPKFI